MRELGHDPRESLARCGLNVPLLEVPDNIIPFRAGARLLHVAAEVTGCPHFGLLLGERQHLGILGAVGYLTQQSPNVRAALEILMCRLDLHVNGATVTLSERGDLAGINYSILLSGVVGREHVLNIAMADTCGFMRSLCGGRWAPTAVHFGYREPPDPRPFRRFFDAPVDFDRETTTLFFPASWLEYPVEQADPELCRVLSGYLAHFEPRSAEDMPDRVRRVLWTLLPTGDTSVERVAQLFSMHRRTLHRRLAERGSTFEQLVDEVRFSMARQMLEDSDLSVTQLAGMLGYREPSGFSRAFRRWSNLSPSGYRRTRRHL